MRACGLHGAHGFSQLTAPRGISPPQRMRAWPPLHSAHASCSRHRHGSRRQEYYGTFARSLYSLFQVLTGESWSEAVARPVVFADSAEPHEQRVVQLRRHRAEGRVQLGKSGQRRRVCGLGGASRLRLATDRGGTSLPSRPGRAIPG